MKKILYIWFALLFAGCVSEKKHGSHTKLLSCVSNDCVNRQLSGDWEMQEKRLTRNTAGLQIGLHNINNNENKPVY